MTTAPSTAPSPAKKKSKAPWIVAGVILVSIGGVVGVGSMKDTTPTPTKNTTPAPKKDPVELCAMIRDPANDILERSDIERMAGWSGAQLDRYVRERCPDLLWRIG